MRLSSFCAILLIGYTSFAFAQSSPVHLTAQVDHKRLMDLLGMTSIRPGANGRDAQATNAANYDESKVLPLENLPDPLLLRNGKKVTSEKMWWSQRRPEIVADFDQEILGRVPSNVPRINWRLTGTSTDTIAEHPVLVKIVEGYADNSQYPSIDVTIQLRLTSRIDIKSRAPVVMELAWSFPPGQSPPTQTPGPTGKEQVIEKGWAYAEIYPTSIQPDNGASLTVGIIGLANKGQPRSLDDWGALRAWAWGASRALDYLETDKAVDAKRVGIEGHSRYGKAAVVAMAYDPRFTIGFISSSGEGGLSLYRRNFGEIVENVAGTGEYHWMAGNFIKYAGKLQRSDLPIDAHELIALCAPRPVFISSGDDGDQWTDPKGMFLAGVYAGPVYKLLGKKDLGTNEYPAREVGLMNGEISFRQHSGGHTPGPNWSHFIAYADKYLGK